MFENFFSFGKKDENKEVMSSVDSLHSEHLKEGVSPIIACVGTNNDFRDNPGELSKAFWTEIDPAQIEDVPFFIHLSSPKIEGQKRGENRESYVISALNEMDKRSRTLRNCTAVAVAGQDKKTGENISFISHESPKYMLSSKKDLEMFFNDLKIKLEELKEKSVEGTIDAAIAGGTFYSGDKRSQKEYMESVRLLSDEISKILGFPPVVIVGPKVVEISNVPVQDEIFYSNKFRRLYVVRPEKEDVAQRSFLAKDIKEEARKWEKESSDAQAATMFEA